MFDWNDLRYLLALAQHGSTLAAGRALRVDPSTVQRRVAELERRIGQSLVQRETAGYRLTEFGQALLPHARQVAQAVEALEQHLESARREAVGVIRVTCPEPLVSRLAASGLLDRFHARYPGLHVEFVMSDRYLDLAKGEIDVALRSGDTVDGALIGRKIGDSLWAVYASRAYVALHGQPRSVDELARHALVGFDAAMSGHRAAVWLRSVAPPCATAIADAEQELVRVLGPVPELARIWRILTTAELRRTPRVAAFFDFVVEEIDALRPVLTG